MEKNKNVEIIDNSDMYCSAFLIASGYPPQSQTNNHGIITFSFIKSDEIESLLDSYYSLQGSVNPSQFVSAIKNLKSMIYKNKYKEPITMNEAQKWNRKRIIKSID